MEVKLQSGDAIAIPEGCKAVVKDGSVTIEKEVQEFKEAERKHTYKGELTAKYSDGAWRLSDISSQSPDDASASASPSSSI